MDGAGHDQRPDRLGPGGKRWRARNELRRDPRHDRCRDARPRGSQAVGGDDVHRRRRDVGLVEVAMRVPRRAARVAVAGAVGAGDVPQPVVRPAAGAAVVGPADGQDVVAGARRADVPRAERREIARGADRQAVRLPGDGVEVAPRLLLALRRVLHHARVHDIGVAAAGIDRPVGCRDDRPVGGE